jgi:excisionase family DNA binding protein
LNGSSSDARTRRPKVEEKKLLEGEGGSEMEESSAKEDDGSTLIAVPEARKRLGGISKWKLYQLMHENKIKGVKIGSRTLFPSDSIADYIELLKRESEG